MHIGFILTKTPSEEGFKTFLEFFNLYRGSDDLDVFLLGSGVYCARRGHQCTAEIYNILEEGSLHVITEDLKARGISPDQTFPDTNLISYKEFVHKIMEDIDEILSF